MTGERERSPEAAPPPMTRGSLRLGSLFDIELRLDVSVALIFLLIVYSLADGLLPGWHPDWSATLCWVIALAAGLLFFASLMAHELAHSVVAQHFGLRVPRITLFLLGGVSELSREPDSPRTEFLMAIAGPLMSLVLGLCFTWLGSAVAGGGFTERLVEDEAAALASLSPLATVLLWLGPVNLLLAVFNMLPGFPLDGGRVLRALLWWWTRDQLLATRWASNVGRIFGLTFMVMGVWSVLSGQGLGGLWLVLIGWFLTHSATSSFTQTWMQHALSGHRVAQVMRTHFEHTHPDLPLARFVDEQLLRTQQLLWPVVEDGRLRGWISQDRVADLGEARRGGLCVRDLMQPPETVETLAPDASVDRAMAQLAVIGELPMPVLDGDRVVGLISAADVLRWMRMHPPQ